MLEIALTSILLNSDQRLPALPDRWDDLETLKRNNKSPPLRRGFASYKKS